MKKITLLISAIALSMTSFTVIAESKERSITIGKDDIIEMSRNYISITNEKLDLDLSNKQTEELTNVMVDYIYQFKKATSVKEAKQLEEEFGEQVKIVLNDEQWKVVEQQREEQKKLYDINK